MAKKYAFEIASGLKSKHLTDAEYIKGGYFIANSITAMKEMPVCTEDTDGVIVKGSFCYCTEDSKFYQYNGTDWLSNTVDISSVLSEYTPTDEKVKQNSLSSGTTNYYLLASSTSAPTSGTAYEANYNTSVKLNGNGQLTASSFYATSDKRKKENIKEFIPQKSILDLPVVEFDFKDSGAHQIGCIAQDLQEICPEIVSADESGYLSINESKIVYLLLDEVKKLRKEVNELRSK